MTELDLYKFVVENDIEWHKIDSEDVNSDTVFFVPIWNIEEFNSLVESYILDNDFNCVMKPKYFGFLMNEICEYYGIDTNNVFIEK